MRFVLEHVLSAEDLAQLRALIAQESFVDGRATSARIDKNNLQLPVASAAAQTAGALVLDRLRAHPAFERAVHPRFVFPPLISRYELGMEYPDHVDAAIMDDRRADVAVTVFLSERDSYEGGELVVDTGNGERSYRLEAGDAIVYPASTLHRVAKVTRGTRLAAVTWVQSLVRDAGRRSVLYDLRSALDQLEARGQAPDRLHRSYWNLIRLWAE